jgi:hypothetical protein
LAGSVVAVAGRGTAGIGGGNAPSGIVVIVARDAVERVGDRRELLRCLASERRP